MWYWQKTYRLSHAVLTWNCALTCPCRASRGAGAGHAMKCSASNPKWALRRLVPPHVLAVCTEVLARVPKHGEPLELCWWVHTSSQHQALHHRGINPEQGSVKNPTGKLVTLTHRTSLCDELTHREPHIPQAWQDVWHIEAYILNLHLYSTRPIN